jgi:hypothetical protein
MIPDKERVCPALTISLHCADVGPGLRQSLPVSEPILVRLLTSIEQYGDDSPPIASGGPMTVAREPTLAVENGAAPPHRQPTGVRASDRERQDVVDRLHRALGEGRLDLDETDARVAAAYATRTREDLVPLVADLPPDDEVADGKAPDRAAIWTSVVWRLQMLVWGADERAAVRPTAAQCRIAVVLAVALAVWIGACAILGAALVAG